MLLNSHMALLLPSMSAIPHLQHHMTAVHGQPVPSTLSPSTTRAVTQPDNKRPKLSLQTSSLTSTYGSLTRGLAPNTTQTIYTPTTANTLSNTWDLTIRPSPISRTDSPRPIQQARAQPGQQPYTYSVPFGVRPILKNSPLPPRAASVSASPRDSRRKVFFPQPKRVSFRHNLEDLIETSKYVAKHSDLTSSEEESSSDESQQPTTTDEASNVTSTYHASPPPNRKRKVRRDNSVSLDTKAHPGMSSETTITKPPPPHKRRRWHTNNSFGQLIEKEGQALRSSVAKSTTPEHLSVLNADVTLERLPNNMQTNTGNYESEGTDECRTLAPTTDVEELSERKDLATSQPSSERQGSSQGDQNEDR